MFVLYVTVYGMLNSFIWQQMSGMSEVGAGDREGCDIFCPLGYLLPTIVSDTSSISATIEEVLCKFYILFT